MKTLIRKILKEETSNKFIEKVVKHLNPPYIKDMRNFGVTEDEYPLVFNRIFNQPVSVSEKCSDFELHCVLIVYNNQGEPKYYERKDGYWENFEYDDKGNLIYTHDTDDRWDKYEYDDQGNLIYWETYHDYWEKYEYDDKGNLTHKENSSGSDFIAGPGI